ncbi:hypothetical protein [Kamptonema formosum]|uniref:hypothetical protein n=1 Tax=Kamptonema formosum TaxID=331992 RepID=UPI00034A462F|nr:hypothetical protein [Oscillatoria sp. PCC 10802]
MVDVYLWLFIAICTGLLCWGMTRPDRIYQYPFFMGAIFLSFILPQAISLINNPGPVSQEALERVLLMSCLCAGMCWLGYQFPLSTNFIKRIDISLEGDRLLRGGIFFVLIGYIFSFLISRLPESATENSQWTGPVTIYAFFAGLIYPGLTIILSSTLNRPSKFKIILTILAAWIPLQTIIFFGRRQTAATFILTIGLCLYYYRQSVPPRWIAIVAILGALIIIPLTNDYRAIAGKGQWDQLLELRPVETLNNLVEEGKVLELRNAAILIDATVKTGQYGYGADYWNSLIFRFIPGQLIGKKIKKALQIKKEYGDLSLLYSYRIPTGSTPTGIADSFIQFDYLGCLFFGLVAYLFKNLWFSAIYRQSVAAQLFYVSLTSPAMVSLTHGTVRFTSDLVFYSIFIGSLVLYSSQKTVK